MELYRLIPGHVYKDQDPRVLPRVPRNRLPDEDDLTPRICVAASLDDCLTSIGFTWVCIDTIQKTMEDEAELFDKPEQEDPLWPSLWRRLRFPFTLLTFQIDYDDPDLWYPSHLRLLVPDVEWTNEYWITKPMYPASVEHLWLYDAKAEERIVDQDLLGCWDSIVQVSGSKWSYTEQEVTPRFAKNIKEIALQELRRK